MIAPTAALTPRALQLKNDLPSLTAILEACNLVDDLEGVGLSEELAHMTELQEHYDPAQDAFVVVVDNQLVAFGSIHFKQETQGGLVFSHNSYVTPAWRGRGVGTCLLHALTQRAQEIYAQFPEAPLAALQVRIPSTAQAEIKFLEQQGYQRTLQANFMRHDRPQAAASFPLPAGFELRPPTPDAYHAIWEASNEAFCENWGSTTETEADYRRWRTSSTFTPHLWQVAWTMAQPSEVAGMVLTLVDEAENIRMQRRRAYTETICVRKPYRRQGLARALVTAALHCLSEAGFTEAALYVDANNPTGARHLYEGLGYQTVKAFPTYRKALPRLLTKG